MKALKKILALLLCTAMLVCFTACATNENPDIPEGMKIASATGADFRLYVPTVWNLNNDYGMSGAYFNLAKQSTVNVMRYEITDAMNAAMTEAGISGGDRLDWFWETECKASVETLALGGTLTEVEDEEEAEKVVLDDLNARRHHLKATVKGENMHFVHVIAEREGGFYVFSYTVVDELYASLLPHVETMLENFHFDEPYLPEEYPKELDENAKAPDGMKLASNDDVAYRFYVPTNWQINREEKIFSAYLESDRSSVSVVPYMPDGDSMSVAQFFELNKEMMINTAGEEGFDLLSTFYDVDLGGRSATVFIYCYKVNGVFYQYMQVVAAYKSMIYSLTYTALPENFEAHLPDVNRMMEVFEFR